jgi:pyruvate, orthophosphate dikinase
VPPGFTITTEACNAYIAADQTIPDGLWDEVRDAMAAMERATGKTYGGTDDPLLVAVRSGAKFSMPGMMDTVLNVGMNDEVAEAMVRRTGDERFVLDSHRRLVQMFGTVVLGMSDEPFEAILRAERREHDVINDADLGPTRCARSSTASGRWSPTAAATPFPDDPRAAPHGHRGRVPRAGTAGGPSTTAAPRRSPTTSAPR